MPFTPFHFGIFVLFFSLFFPMIDPIGFFISTGFPDIEGITALFILPNSGLPLHGPLHSLTVAMIVGVVIGIFSNLFIELAEIFFLQKKNNRGLLTKDNRR